MIILQQTRGVLSSAVDSDARNYIAAVEAADGQSLESATRIAINTFVKGCKADGIWNAIKSSCILAGARTLSGAIVPLRGTAPTNFNFVSGDYNRKTGLVGDGSTKYLNSNRNNNADPQNSFHQSLYMTVVQNAPTRAFIGAGATNQGSSQISTVTGGNTEFRNRSSTAGVLLGYPATGVIGSNRSNSSNFIGRNNGSNQTFSINSQTPFDGNALLFARLSGIGVAGLFTTSRIAFYSIGESLDIALLDSRVSTLMTDLTAAIP